LSYYHVQGHYLSTKRANKYTRSEDGNRRWYRCLVVRAHMFPVTGFEGRTHLMTRTLICNDENTKFRQFLRASVGEATRTPKRPTLGTRVCGGMSFMDWSSCAERILARPSSSALSRAKAKNHKNSLSGRLSRSGARPVQPESPMRKPQQANCGNVAKAAFSAGHCHYGKFDISNSGPALACYI